MGGTGVSKWDRQRLVGEGGSVEEQFMKGFNSPCSIVVVLAIASILRKIFPRLRNRKGKQI